MDYVATREITADGKVYRPGDMVPADSWPANSRRAVLNLGWIKPMPRAEGSRPAETKLPAGDSPPDTSGQGGADGKQGKSGQVK